MKKTLTMALVAGLALCVGVGGASAEGMRSSYLRGWHGVQAFAAQPATVSKTWADSNSDNASTDVYLSNVTANLPGTGYTYVSPRQQLQMQKSTLFGWISLGNTTTNTGVVHSWGDLGTGTFRFQWNGATVNDGTPAYSCFAECAYVFDATSVLIYW